MILFTRKHTLALIIILITTSCNSTPNTTNNNTDSILEPKANEAFSKGDYSQAAGLFEKITIEQPNNNQTRFLYAEALRMSGNSGNAILQYDKILLQDKNNLHAMEGKGLAYLQKGELVSSLELLNQVITQDISRWRTINAIGIIHSINGQDSEAEEYYNMALGLSHNNPSIINNIALGIGFTGDREKGIALLSNALNSGQATGNKRVLLENNLALLHGINGDMAAAERILSKTMPQAAVYNNLGFYAKLRDNKELAAEYLNKAITTSPVYYEKAEKNKFDLDDEFNQTDANTTTLKVKAWRGKDKLPLPSFRP